MRRQDLCSQNGATSKTHTAFATMNTKPLRIKQCALLSALLASFCHGAHADPYVGIQYKSLSGIRSTVDYKTSQVNAIVGYEVLTDSDFRHAVEYVGAISSSTGQIAQYNVETTILSVGYKLMYRGLYAKIGIAKLDRDDRDLEATSDRAQTYSIGYEYAFNPTTSVHVSHDYLRNVSLRMSGFSVGAIFRF